MVLCTSLSAVFKCFTDYTKLVIPVSMALLATIVSVLLRGIIIVTLSISVQ